MGHCNPILLDARLSRDKNLDSFQTEFQNPLVGPMRPAGGNRFRSGYVSDTYPRGRSRLSRV